MLRFVFRRRLITVAFLALAASCVFWVVAASADAPDVNTPDIYPSGTQTQLNSVVYDPSGDGGNGTTTVTISGGWSWPTHTSDCNTDRAGAGYAIDWADKNDSGFLVSGSVSVGSTNADGLNPNDGYGVHPTADTIDPSKSTVYVASPTAANYTDWKGGCGTYTSGTYYTHDKNGNKVTNTGTYPQGTWGPISHVYKGDPSKLPTEICALMYDVHGDETKDGTGVYASDGDGLGTPNALKNIVAGGTGHNGDNSLEGNGGKNPTPAGNTCATIDIGTIELKKHWVGAAGDTTLTISGPSSYSKSADANGADGGTGTQWVLAGTYTLSETNPAGYSSALSCTKNGGDAFTPDNNQVAVGKGDAIVCTFTNTRSTGTIEVKKTLVPSNDPGRVDFNIGGTVLDNGGNGYGNGGDTGPQTVGVGTGIVVSESGHPGTDSSNYTSSYVCTKNGSPYLSGDSGSVDDGVDLAQGDAIVCTFTNTAKATIVVTEHETGGNVPFSFTGDLTGSLSDGNSTSEKVPAGGTYTTTQTQLSGWTLTNVTCSTDGTPDLGSFDATYNPGPGETVHCDFYNTRDTGSIDLEKHWVGGAGNTTVTITGPNSYSDSADANGADGGTGPQTVPTGTYTLSETAASGYTASLSCTRNGGDPFTPADNQVDLAKGDAVVCTYTNTRDTGTIEFVKVVDGGSAKPGDFTFNVNGGQYHNGDSASFDTGSYTLTENGPAGYTLTDASGACSLDGGTVTLAVTTDGGTCTITNTRDTGTLDVHKTVLPSSDQGTFDFTFGGTTYDNGTDGYGNGDSTGAQTLDTGSYSVSESGNGDTNLSDYTSTWSCDNGTSGSGTTIPSVAIGKDAAVNCTFTNTKKATIVIEEKTVGGDTSFTFTGHPSGSLSNTQTSSEQVAAGGTYTSIQTQKSGWTLTDLTCDSNNATANKAGDKAVFDPAPGETITCVFTNTKQSTPTTPSTPSTPPPAIDLAITKSGSPNPATRGKQITWTEVVTNNGPDGATGVTVTDAIPSGTTFVSVVTTQGSCSGGATVSCSLGSMAKGAKVTITLVTTADVTGTITNTTKVGGNETDTDTSNNTASASVVVNAPFTPPAVKPPKVKPPKVKPPTLICSLIVVRPNLLYVGRTGTLVLHLKQKGKAAKGVRVLIKGPGLHLRTRPSNKHGVIRIHVKPKKAGILHFTAVKPNKGCKATRIGVTGVFTPPVTG